jgi:hypothetical protein
LPLSLVGPRLSKRGRKLKEDETNYPADRCDGSGAALG